MTGIVLRTSSARKVTVRCSSALAASRSPFLPELFFFFFGTSAGSIFSSSVEVAVPSPTNLYSRRTSWTPTRMQTSRTRRVGMRLEESKNDAGIVYRKRLSTSVTTCARSEVGVSEAHSRAATAPGGRSTSSGDGDGSRPVPTRQLKKCAMSAAWSHVSDARRRRLSRCLHARATIACWSVFWTAASRQSKLAQLHKKPTLREARPNAMSGLVVPAGYSSVGPWRSATSASMPR